MKTKPLNLAISESLWQELQFLAEATDQSLESLAVNCIVHQLPQVRQQVQELDEFLEKVTPENIHGEMGLQEIGVSYVP
jgi:antitoxin component of MazEF toxin-antitoxin module